MSKIIPIHGVHENWRAAFAEAQERGIERLVIWVQPEDAESYTITYNMTRSHLAFAALHLQHDAVYGEAEE